jgi:hypothetical protein
MKKFILIIFSSLELSSYFYQRVTNKIYHQAMLTCTLASMTESHTGQVPIRLDPHNVHRHRCLHGSSNTLDSLSPHFLHIRLWLIFLLLLLSFTTTNLSFTTPSSPPAIGHLPWSLLPQLDSASSATVAPPPFM